MITEDNEKRDITVLYFGFVIACTSKETEVSLMATARLEFTSSTCSQATSSVSYDTK